MTSAPLLSSVNYQYFSRLLDWRKLSYQWAGSLPIVEGFTDYNQLININQIFSNRPFGDPVDRTGTIQGPLNFRILRPWVVPQKSLTIDQVFEARVKYYTDQNCQLNLFWSGGTDSTAMVTAFLKHAPNLDQLKLVYSPHSLYENRDFFEFVTKQFPKLNTLDFSGDVYLNHVFDGIVITGHGGDEFTASLDESFFDQVGTSGLQQDWRSFFRSKSAGPELINFCEEYFAKSGRPIDTVLEARWWFYAATKSQVYGPRDVSFLFNHDSVALDHFASFFDCELFETYMWHNIDKIFEPGQEYKTYKKFLRQYVYDFYKNLDYLENSSKMSSMQFQAYQYKKIELLNLQWICILEDATVIRTKNLPLLSQKEFVDIYGNSLDYLFNQPH